MGTASKVFMFLIPLVVLIVVLAILFRPEEGLFDKAKGLILGAKDVLPKISVGLEEQKAEVTIPDAHREEIILLGDTIKGMLKLGNKNCFSNAGTMSDLGEGGTSLEFDLRGDKTLLTVSGGAGGKQTIADLAAEFPGLKPCVIAGEGGISKNFFTHFIDEKELYYPYFKEASSLTIWYGTSGADGNRISVGGFDSGTVNDENDNFENEGWLFTPDGQHVCFFPTNKVANYDDDGIDNDYFSLGEKNSIQFRIDQGELQLCS
ncbi:MAG: hypothetical protein Q7S55_01615 [Nanoarchaeota archaeon]|nr:hypothetical protein [Nanoarchaeota archaeon]